MKVSVQECYTAAACNRISEVVDWNNNGIICYGAKNAVIIYDTQKKDENPLKVYIHHKCKVNSVKWLHKPDNSCTEFVSCSADKTAAIWTLEDSGWKITSSLIGHTKGVTSVHGTYTNRDNLVVFTGSIDSSIKIWERNDGVTSLKHTINLNSGLCLTLYSHKLPTVNQPVLFCALDDHKVHIYVGDDYQKVHTLVGHEDWVRGLDVLDIDESSVLLATASQDTYIRLWRIQLNIETEPSSEIQVEQKVFHAYGKDWSVKLDAVLAGHEGWVYGVQWHPLRYNEDSDRKVPVFRLLSSSIDKTLIIWEPDSLELGNGAWIEKVRVGEVGGNGLGFYGSRFGPNGKSFLGHGYNGSFHIWSLNEETKQWLPDVVCGGHFGPVEDARWEPEFGRYLLTVSADQTTRLHAPWLRPDVKDTREWHEIARPQVHGYDMASIAPINSTTFVSAAEEKVIRVFRAPHNFLKNFTNIVGEKLVAEEKGGPEGASVPSLGLSNKAVFNEEQEGNDKDENDGYFVPVELKVPPTEETLMQNTLWPEVHKLYGHGYEVYALDASPDGRLLASACRATTADHAAVLIWETTNWQQIQKLVRHQLTVTQLAFSPDSRRLLAVSRDRNWTMFKKNEATDLFEVAAYTDRTNNVHTRVIWCCAWAFDGAMFATGSREGKVCVWAPQDRPLNSSLQEYGLLGAALELPSSSVTALSFAPFVISGMRIIAAGLESGVIKIYSYCPDFWKLLHELDNNAAHHLTVRRLVFNPVVDSDERNETRRTLLASCGGDHLVRIQHVTVSALQ